MGEVEITNIVQNGLINQALYLFAFAFLTWFAGRAAIVTNESGNANIFSKIVITAFGLSSIYYLNLQFAYVEWHLRGFGHSLAVLKESGGEISNRGIANIDLFGGSANEVPDMNLIPSDPIALILIGSLTLIMLSAIWMNGSNND